MTYDKKIYDKIASALIKGNIVQIPNEMKFCDFYALIAEIKRNLNINVKALANTSFVKYE